MHSDAAAMTPPSRWPRLRRGIADGCHLALSLLLWLSGTVLVALGLMLAFAIFAADLQPLLFFAHVDNLATHYLAADPVRRAQFDMQLLALFTSIVTLLLLARLPGFVIRMRRELGGAGQS